MSHGVESQQQVACKICLKEIPASEAKSSEAQDYIIYFCGLECYDKWRRRAQSAMKRDSAVDKVVEN